ncbi:GH13322 [Drosophila grimshawi]|uniref:GH13322 n=1 Tax=Drosophila grimshawi TaxID=7222 RepID=B4JTY7_DROGR|nr:GH13322 [Drosophila grimshawi]
MYPRRHAMKAKPLLNRDELLQSIVRDRALLNAYFLDIAKKESQSTVPKGSASILTPKSASAVQQRDSYDLFFESACISIKSLPPKLAAEAKNRISHVITEFELRAISEHEAQQAMGKQELVKAIRVSNEPVMDPSTGIVYEFQACS